MVCDLARETFTAAATSFHLPYTPKAEGGACKVRRKQPAGAADILAIGANPAPVVYLSGLFRRFGWTVRLSMSLEGAVAFLQENKAAVAICEEELPDGTWRDAARILPSVPNAPMIVVIGSDRPRIEEVMACGCFDVLTRPLREVEVIWTVASAWHQWMNRFQSVEGGGPRCSDA